MRKVWVISVGVLFFSAAGARSQTFDQQLLHISQMAAVAAQQTREDFPAKMQKASLQEAAWHAISAPDGSFTAEMPAVPEYRPSQLDWSATESSTLHDYVLVESSRSFRIEALLQPSVPSNPQAALIGLLNAVTEDLAKGGAKWGSGLWKTNQGVVSFEVFGGTSTLELRFLAMMKGRQTVIASYIGPKGTATSKEIERYFGSVVIR